MARILVVDDEETIRDLLHTVLRRLGHEVLLADRGQQGIEVFRRERPQITILDLSMPDLNGIAVLKEVRTVDPQASVIILTGTGTEALERQARELGVSDFLAKGFSLHALGQALKRVLSQPGRAASA